MFSVVFNSFLNLNNYSKAYLILERNGGPGIACISAQVWSCRGTAGAPGRACSQWSHQDAPKRQEPFPRNLGAETNIRVCVISQPSAAAGLCCF